MAGDGGGVRKSGFKMLSMNHIIVRRGDCERLLQPAVVDTSE